MWDGIVGQFELSSHELRILQDACYTADTIDRLREDLHGRALINGRDRCPAVLVEIRMQSLALARLLVALRIPDEVAPGEARVQRRGLRGVYVSHGPVA